MSYLDSYLPVILLNKKRFGHVSFYLLSILRQNTAIGRPQAAYWFTSVRDQAEES